MDKMWNQYPDIKKQLKQVLKIIEDNSRCKDKVIENSILELVNSGGKMLRPAFVIIASKWGENDDTRKTTNRAFQRSLSADETFFADWSRNIAEKARNIYNASMKTKTYLA